MDETLFKKLFDYIIVTLLLISISGNNYAQGIKDSGINLGVKFGGSKLLGEFPRGTSGVFNEFDNKYGIASGFEISKYVSPRWEIGGDLSYSQLKGDTSNPEFYAQGKHYLVPVELNAPVEYKNSLLGFNFLFRYFFKPADSESAFIPFVSGGLGYLQYYSTFKYTDAPDDDLLFGKGKNGYAVLSTPVFIVGTGIKTYFSSKFYLHTSIDFKMVDYDFLDVMHNYNNDGTRIKITGLYTEFKVGIFYNISKSSARKNKQSKNTYGKSTITSYLPFSN